MPGHAAGGKGLSELEMVQLPGSVTSNLIVLDKSPLRKRYIKSS